MTFYERLKVDLNNDELNYDNLVNYIEFDDLEKEIFYRIFCMGRLTSFFVDKWGKSTVYRIIIPQFTEIIEKDIYAKLVILDNVKSIKNKENDIYKFLQLNENYIVHCLKNIATDELRNDKDFANVLLKVNGKYFSGFSKKIRNNNQVARLALINDKDKLPKSFLNASYSFKKNPNNALLYIKKISSYYSADEIYENLLKFSEKQTYIYPYNNKFIGENKNHQLQKRWLASNDFLVGLQIVNDGLKKYIDSGDIIRYAGDYGNNRNKVKSKIKR